MHIARFVIGLTLAALCTPMAVAHESDHDDLRRLRVELQAAAAAIAELRNTLEQETLAREHADRRHRAALEAMRSNSVLKLDGILTMRDRKTVLLRGVNLQIVNGTGTTDGEVNGRGNLIIGYNVPRKEGARFCSLGVHYRSERSCLAAGGEWALNLRTGSHNLVIGDNHNYIRYGGAVLGVANNLFGEWASVYGGSLNLVGAAHATVVGGYFNSAEAEHSVITGGRANSTYPFNIEQDNLGFAATISGGVANSAQGDLSAICGGSSNNTIGVASTICGGAVNAAGGFGSTVSGGQFNGAEGNFAAVSGGSSNTASGDNSSVTGGDRVSCRNDTCGEGSLQPSD